MLGAMGVLGTGAWYIGRIWERTLLPKPTALQRMCNEAVGRKFKERL